MLAAVSASSQGLIIPSGSYVIQQGGNLIMGQDWTNNGSFTQNAGTVVFSGSSQNLSGSATTFKHLTISSRSTTAITTTAHTITDILKTNGTLNADNKLTLLSSTTKTALVDGASTGAANDIVMQRYLSSGFGYKYFSSPFQASTVNEFSDEIDLGSAGDFPGVHGYDETLNSTGWVYYNNSSNTLTPLRGYAVQFGTSSSPLTVDIAGDANNGSVSINLFNNNNTYTQGFNLVGNPYPSPIDWDATSGWTRTNIDDAVYYFDASNSDQYGGTYSSYINGVSSDGIADNIIPAMQAFFVHVTDGSYPVSGSLGMDNNVRVNTFNPAFHKLDPSQSPLLRIAATFAGGKKNDAAVIYFDTDASMGFDLELDAMKMMNTDAAVPNLYVLPGSGVKMSICGMPDPADSINMVPLGLETAKDGDVQFKINDMDNIPSGLNIYLTDAKTKTIQDVRINPVYQTTLAKGKHDSRFSIVFSKNPLSDSLFAPHSLNAYSSNGKIFVYLNLLTGEKGTLVVVNTLGQVIARHELNGFGYHEIPASYSSGIYIVSFYANSNVYSKKLFLGNN